MAAYRKDENIMAKGTLIFDLPAEEAEFRLAQNGLRYSCVIDSIQNFLRQKQKYDGKEVVDIEELKEFIRFELEDSL
jgi:hypothetical protein